MTRLLRILCLTLALFLIWLSPRSVHSQDSLTFQVHPYLPAGELLTRFSPLLEYLEEKTGKKITCNISKNYDDHINLVGTNKVDLAFLGPASYIKLVNQYGNKPLLARLEVNGEPFFQGVIITRKDSSISSLKDLKGKRFAFGDPLSTMSNQVPLYMLHQEGITIKELADYSHLRSHQNVALGVLIGDFDAGSVKEEVFYAYRDRGLKDLLWTPKISEHLFVANSSLPKELIAKIRDALLNLKDDKRASSILTPIKKDITALVPVHDEDYTNLRAIIISLDNLKNE